MTSTLLGYARVSTADQVPALQLDALEAAGCWRTWTDHASGKLDQRPQFCAVLEALRPGDTLVVWRFDRRGRSLRPLIDTVGALEARGVVWRRVPVRHRGDYHLGAGREAQLSRLRSPRRVRASLIIRLPRPPS